DDIVIHARDTSKHDELFFKVMQRFKEKGLRVNPKKVQFRKSEVELLGVTIDGDNRNPSEITRNLALESKRPECVKELRTFLGLAGWFREFIGNFAMITVALTEALKGNKKWKWSDEMESEFTLVKEELRNIRSLKIPDYNKSFRLRTDACDTGLGAVLLQTNSEGKWVPIQWASKKLTPTERRYTITEKEMLAVVWGIEKFEYELRGRRFELMTDHKALEEIRNKPYFNNNRVNRWIERIQEYDFSVQYVKGELMGDADALSRQFQEEKQKENKLKGISKQTEWKIMKHTIINREKEYAKFDDGSQKEIPKIEERNELIEEIHTDLNHRGVKATHYKLKQKYYWPGMKDSVTRILKECETCQVANRKTKGGVEFVTANRKGEKFAIDIMEIGEPRRRILIGIDYFTRYVYAKQIKERTSEEIISVLEEWFTRGDVPEVLISD
ncbi:Transposon Tf2-6 polyprotein, partial [Nosema granulosis]